MTPSPVDCLVAFSISLHMFVYRQWQTCGWLEEMHSDCSVRSGGTDEISFLTHGPVLSAVPLAWLLQTGSRGNQRTGVLHSRSSLPFMRRGRRESMANFFFLPLSLSLHPLTLKKSFWLISLTLRVRAIITSRDTGERNGDSSGCQKRLLFWSRVRRVERMAHLIQWQRKSAGACSET